MDNNIQQDLVPDGTLDKQFITPDYSNVGKDVTVSMRRRVLARSLLPFIGVLMLILFFIIWQTSTRSNSNQNVLAYKTPSNIIDTSKLPVLAFSDTDRKITEVIFNDTIVSNGAIVITPNLQPTESTTGQIYYDKQSNNLRIYNGTQYESLFTKEDNQQVCFVGGACGFLTASDIPRAVLLPQDLSVSASPTFAGLNLASDLSVSNGGTGASSFANNSLLIGKGAGAIVATNSASSGQLVVASSDGLPQFVTVSGDVSISTNGTTSLSTNSVDSNELVNSGVSAGVYGDAVNYPVFTVDADGRIVSASTLILPGGGSGVGSLNALVGALTLQGTSNQINIVSGGSNITLSTPQDIASTSSPTFNGLTVSSIVRGLDTITDFSGSGLQVTAGSLQTTLGTSVDLTTEITGTLALGNGGTNATTAQAAINNISGLTANGDLLYSNGTNSTRLGRGTDTQCLLSNSTTILWGTCTGAGSGVTTVGTLNGGTANANGATITGTTIFLQSASSSFAGLVDITTQTFAGNKTFSGLVTLQSGVTISASQTINIAGDSVSDFTGTGITISSGSLQTTLGTSVDLTSEITGTLAVANGGTGAVTLGSNGVLVGNGTGTITSVVAGGANLCLTSTAGAPIWASCPGSGGSVTSLNTLTSALTLQGTANQITVADNGTDTITLSLPQNIAVTSSPTFNGLSLTSLTISGDAFTDLTGTGLTISAGSLQTTLGTSVDLTTEITGTLALGNGGTNATTALGARGNLGAAASGANSDITSLTGLTAITPSSALSIGATGQSLTLQGTSATTITATSGGFTTTVGFGTPTTNATINFPILAAGTYDICTTSGNCLGGGGGANTALSNLSAVAINTSLLSGSATIDLGSATNPFRDIYLGGTATNNFRFTGSATSARTLTIPDASGTLAVSASGNIALSGAGNVSFTGTLGASNGGTGNNSYIAGDLLYASGASTLSRLAVGTPNQCLLTSGGNLPVWGTCVGDGSGISTVGAIDSQTPSANGAVISGSTIYLQSASATAPGAINVSTQSFAGVKTFNNGIILAAGQSLSVTGGNTASRPGSPTEGMVYFDTTTKQLLTYANGKWQADRTTVTKIVAASNSTQSAKDSADYVADGTADQTEINSALTAAAGGKVYLMPGTYITTATILVPNNTTLSGSGRDSTFIEFDDIDISVNMIQSSGVSKTGQTIRDLTLNGREDINEVGGLFMDGISFFSTDNAVIDNVTVKNFRYYGVSVGGNNTTINNSIAEDNGSPFTFGDGFYVWGGNKATITNSIARDSTGEQEYGFRLDSTSVTAIGNLAIGNLSTGFGIGNGGSQLSNNTATNNGIGFRGAFGVSLVGNSAIGNTATGYYISGDSNNINNNIAKNNGGATANEGIYLDGASNSIISGNLITDSACTTTCYAINISAISDKNYLSGNRYTGSATDAASINDIGTNTIYDNQQVNSTTSTNSDITDFRLRGSSNSTTAFAVQNASGASILNVDTTNGEVELGDATTAGKLVVSDGSSNTATILVASTSGNYTYTIPTTTANDTFCLVTLGNCGGGGLSATLVDNITNSWDIQEGTNNYININTTNASENISYGNATTNPSYNFLGTGTLAVASAQTIAGNLSVDTNVLFVDTTANRVGINTTPSVANSVLEIGANSSGNSLVQFKPTAGNDTVLTFNSGVGDNLILIADDTNESIELSANGGTILLNFAGVDVTSGALLTAGTTRLSGAGALSNITGYIQSSGSFAISGAGTFGTGTGAISLNGATSVTGSNTLTVGTGLTSLGGGLSVTAGNTTLTADLTVNGNTTIGNATTDRLTVTSQLLGSSPLVFQGATDNGFASTFTFAEPTANNTITFPDASGTVLLAPTGSGNGLVQVPTSNSAGVAGANIIAPTAASIVGLTVNGTTSTAAIALAVAQTGNATAATIAQSSVNNGLVITSTNASQVSTTGLSVTQSGTSTGFTGNFVNFVGSSTTGAGNLLNLTSVNTSAGNALNVTANALTTGNVVNINSTSTGLTTGSLLNVSSATTGAIATNGIVSLNATGNYTSTSNAALLNVLANATTAGTVANISGSALTTGTALNVTATSLTTGAGITVNAGTAIAIQSNGNITFGELTGTRTLGVQTRTAANVGTSLTVSAGTGNGANSGGTLTLQGGNAGASGNINGGNVVVTGGTGFGTGVRGLVVIDTATYSAATVQNFTANANITQTNIDSFGSILISGNVAGWVATLTDPTQTTSGRVIYITNTGTVDITLGANTVGVALSISLKPASTATMYWNGVDWTAAGASSSTDLQAAYNNTATSAGGAEIVLSSTGTGGLTIRNDAATPIVGGLLEVQTSIGSSLFTVNNNATEFAANGGAESSTFSAWLPASGAVTETVARNVSDTGDIIATGTASTSVLTTAVAGQGAENTLTSTLVNGLKYQVSYAIKSSSGTGSFTELDTMFSYDGSAANARHCVSGTAFYSTGTASQTTTTITGVGTTFTASMVGMTFVFADGRSTVVSGFTNATTLTAATSQTATSQSFGVWTTGYKVNSATWTRITCTFTAAPTGTTITAANSVMIRQTSGAVRTFYIDNLSINVSADVNHAADGSVDNAALSPSWTDFGANTAGTTTAVRNTTVLYDTSGSVEKTTGATASRGIVNNLTIAPSISTQYLVTLYARSSNAFNDIRIRYSRDGGTNFASCVDYNTQTVSTTTYTKITCVFTTDGSAPSNADLIIDQPTATARTFYIDALSVTLNTNNSSNVQIGGGNYGGPTTLFTLDRGSNPPIAANNEAFLGSMYYDTTSGRIQCYEADGWGACGAAPDNIVNLNPEYAGAVLNGTGVGTMTSDFCGNGGGLSINTTLCASGEAKNFYKWTSPQATQQTYSIYVTYQLPATFNGFTSDDTVQLAARVDNTTNASVTYEMYRSVSGALTQCGSGETNVITGGGGSANTWYSYGVNGNEATGCTLSSASANGFVIFKINMKANSNASAYVGTLNFVTAGR